MGDTLIFSMSSQFRLSMHPYCFVDMVGETRGHADFRPRRIPFLGLLVYIASLN
ncbi:hypothetical protein SLEP1_g30993 [Rubroshorea leprosula]|uniref:Transposase n=1 Tax=Rubroshorea leprosula TaxID=152421 RepID=A0AAV5K775_9ROSI|nr:hypothetical protein SLEP1_g30993 [Rubroshorea leprosula]